MYKTGRNAILLAAAFLLFPALAGAQATTNDIKLLTRDTGWALINEHLYWTTDFGQHWRDITPPEAAARGPVSIANVVFLDASSGWALLRRADPKVGDWGFEVASTSDSGITWSLAQLTLPSWWRPAYLQLGGDGSIAFADPTHGWIDLSLQSSPASGLGVLLVTNDGGKSWNWLERSLGLAASLRFVSPTVGWAAGGPVDSQLYVTRDGGKTWQQVMPEPPPGVGVALSIETSSLKKIPPAGHGVLPAYGLPVFQDSRRGYLAVSYTGWGDGRWPERLVIYSTDDGGQSWTPVRVLTADEEGAAGTVVPVAIADSALVVPLGRPSGTATTAVVSLVGPQGAAETRPTLKGAYRLSFVDQRQGWALAGSRGPLIATGDGGATWGVITPHPPAEPPHQRPPDGGVPPPTPPLRPSGPPDAGPAQLMAASAKGGGSTKHTSAHLGFDRLGVISVTGMQQWWNDSPYYDVGFYLPGARVGDNNVTFTWVSSVAAQGWGTIPIWDGLQAPCACKAGTWPNCTTSYGPTETFSTDPGTALLQGESEAQTAEAAAAGVGVVNAVIYMDLEVYNSSYQFGSYNCGQIVANFVEGWVSQLPAYGYAAAVYANSQNAESDLWTASPRPSDIWVPRYNSRATVWGLDYKLAGGLADNTWDEGFRAHQFFGNTPETFGGAGPYSVDGDIEWAEVGGGNGTKIFTYPAIADIDCAPPNDTDLLAIDGNGDPVGEYYGPVGFVYSSGACNPSPPCGGQGLELWAASTSSASYAGATTTDLTYYVSAAGGCVALQVAHALPGGVNDDDQVTGYYQDTMTGLDHGFLCDGDTGACSTEDYPGAEQTVLRGSNGFGQSGGIYELRGKWYPFLFDAHKALESQPAFTPLSTSACRGQVENEPCGINNNELISLDCFGYDAVYDYAHSALITTLFYPGSLADRFPSINDSALIAGTWAGSNGVGHGFLSTPQPKP